jgi:hypothetical protein
LCYGLPCWPCMKGHDSVRDTPQLLQPIPSVAIEAPLIRDHVPRRLHHALFIFDQIGFS